MTQMNNSGTYPYFPKTKNQVSNRLDMRRAKKSGDDGAGRSLIRTQNAVEMGFEEARLFTLAEPFCQYRNARGGPPLHIADPHHHTNH
jgi:hypothetical protein